MEIVLTPPPFARQLLSDFTDMDRNPQQLRPEDAAGIPIRLPDDAWFEYAWRDADGVLHTDPDNPYSVRNVWYGQVSVLEGPAWQTERAVRLSRGVEEKGVLERHRIASDALGGQRRVNVYTPPGHGGELPAILVQDGTAFHRIGGITRLLDLMISEGTLPPARLVLLEPVDREAEYLYNPAWLHFMLGEVLPLLDEIAPPAGPPLLMGASLGGLASAWLALAAPGRFAGVASFSGAFLGGPDDRDVYTGESSWLLEQLAAGASVPPRWFIGTGTLEWLTDVNRRVAAALPAAAADTELMTVSAGHNWTAWRNMLAAALKRMLT